MKRLNFVEKADFPLSSTWLDMLHKNNEELASVIVSLVGGDNRIVAGMEIGDDGYCSDGYFVLNGKLYQFRRSLLAAYIVVKSTPIQVQVGSETYTPAVDEWCEFSSTNAGFGIYYRVEDFQTILRVNYNEIINAISNSFKTIETIRVSKTDGSDRYNLVVTGLPNKFVFINGYIKMPSPPIIFYDISIPGVEFDGATTHHMLIIAKIGDVTSTYGGAVTTTAGVLRIDGGGPFIGEMSYNVSVIAKIK